MTFTDVIAGGDLRQSLVAIRDRIAADLEAGKHQDGCTCQCDSPVAGDPRALAALSKELRAVLADIARIPSAEKDDPLDRVESAIAEALANVRSGRSADAEAAAGT